MGLMTGYYPDELPEHATVVVRISPTIANEYTTRCPDDIPEALFDAGKHVVQLPTAAAVLADAEYNSDLKAQDVGEYGMPLPTFNAYRALAKQLRTAIAKVQS